MKKILGLMIVPVFALCAFSSCSGGGAGNNGAAQISPNGGTLTSIAVTPTIPSIAKGTTQQFTATGKYSDNTTKDITASVIWDSSNAMIATIDNRGLVRGAGVGSTTITASAGTISGTSVLTVTNAVLVSIEVASTNPSIANGTTQQFTATGMYSDITTQDITTSVIWDSTNAAVATIDIGGLVRGAGVGSTTITASAGTISGTSVLMVTNAVLVSIEVTPTNPSIANGTKQQFIATGTYSDGTTQNLTSSVTWSSSDITLTTISNAAGSNGLATSIATGNNITITAAFGSISGTSMLTVTNAVLVSIAVTPPNPSIAKGTIQQFMATGTYSDNTTQDITTLVTWDSSNAAIADISNAAGSNGLAAAVVTGSVTITAASGSVSGSTSLTVTPAQLVSIEVTPPNTSIASGTKQQFLATGTYSDGTTQNLTSSATWSSSDADVATISNAAGSNGLATAVATGNNITITAASGSISGSTYLTVTAAVLVSITVTPPNPVMAKGTTQQFTATGTFSDNTTQILTTSVTWSSSNTAVATISNASNSPGLTTAVATGSVTITAASGSISGSTVLTITSATLESITVTPINPSITRRARQQFIATGTYSDGTTLNLTSSVTWSSSNTAVATISNAAGSNGLATASSRNRGTTTIRATSSAATGSRVGSTTLTVR